MHNTYGNAIGACFCVLEGNNTTEFGHAAGWLSTSSMIAVDVHSLAAAVMLAKKF
jgi:hypothetical protein